MIITKKNTNFKRNTFNLNTFSTDLTLIIITVIKVPVIPSVSNNFSFYSLLRIVINNLLNRKPHYF